MTPCPRCHALIQWAKNAKGFRAIGIERDSDYHAMASQRVERMTAQMRLGL